MKRSFLTLLMLALAITCGVVFWPASQDEAIQKPHAVKAVAATNPASDAQASAPAAGPKEERDLKARPTQHPPEGADPASVRRRRAEKIVERMHAMHRLYAPPKVDREKLLAYLRQHPDDVALHVWAAHALHDVTLLPDGEDPMILWARLWLPLSGTQQRHGDFPPTPEFLAMAERLAVLDPGNALPQLLLALISAKGTNAAGALEFLDVASRLPLNDYSGPLHKAGMEYLAVQGWSPTQRLRAKINYLGDYGVEVALQKLLREAAGRPGIASAEKSLFLAARLQHSSIDSSATGIDRMNAKLSEESYAVSMLGPNLGEYMPGKSPKKPGSMHPS